MRKKFRIGRIFSIVTSGILLHLSLQPLGDGGRLERLLMLVPLSVAAWLFFCGKKEVFDYTLTGETSWSAYDTREYESEGGFLSHCTASAMFFTPLCAIDTFVFFGYDLKMGLYWIVPVVLLIMNISAIISDVKPHTKRQRHAAKPRTKQQRHTTKPKRKYGQF